MATAASAVPRRARVMLRVFILASSHRNNGDTVAAGDTNHGSGRNRRGAASTSNCLANSLAEASHGLRQLGGRVVASGNGAALKARHVAASCKGRVGIGRPIGDGEQHLPFL